MDEGVGCDDDDDDDDDGVGGVDVMLVEIVEETGSSTAVAVVDGFDRPLRLTRIRSRASSTMSL